MTPDDLAKSGSEAAHQAALFCYFQINRNKYPGSELLFAIPNGGYRDKITAGRLKATGVKAGVPDICLPVKRGLFSGLWIELKKDYKQKVSAEQREWIDTLRLQGYAALVCVGWIEAKEVIECYLTNGQLPIRAAMKGYF